MRSLPPFPCSFIYDGVQLDSIVNFFTKMDVSIRLTRPFEGIEASLHTPAFCMHKSRHNLDENNNLTDKGVRNIRLCMINAYEKSKMLEKYMPTLLPKVVGAVLRIAELESVYKQKLLDLQEQKRLMKLNFKIGTVTEQTYKAVIRQIRLLEKEQRRQIDQIRTGVFDAVPELASVMPYGDENQFFDYVLRYTRQ